MKRLVIDANIAVKWFFPEIYAQDAVRVLDSEMDLLAPDYIWAEVASVFRKKVRQKEAQEQEIQTMYGDFLHFSIQTYPSKPLIVMAMTIARQLSISVYDAVYLALAVSQGTVLVTADRKMYNAINVKPLMSHVLWIEDIK